MMSPGRRRQLFGGMLYCISFFPALMTLFSCLSFSGVAFAASSGVIGIDLGTEYLKATLVKPGIPLEIVLTKDSKRKESAAVAFKTPRDNQAVFPERYYGGDALALAARFPDDVYANLKTLLGVPYQTGIQGPDGPQENVVSLFRGRYPSVQIEKVAERGTVGFRSSKLGKEEARDPFLVEEMLAMQLKQIKHNAEVMGGHGTVIEDAVITFPAYYTAEEKRSIELAAELADLNVLTLISDGLAVGLNYGTSRTFPSATDGQKPQYHVIYDMGAGSTTATVLRFQSRTVQDVGKFNKTVQEIQVMGTGWDKHLGGDSLNQVIVDDMVTKFINEGNLKDITPEDVKRHGRTMAKLWKESERMRQMLSANSESSASFEGLFHEEVNFRYKISRADFEKLTQAYAKRVETPLIDSLAASKLVLDDIESIILHGGAVRTPFVQKSLESITKGSDKVRTNVNSDEAAVFGAAFKGAAIHPSFRVKEFRTGDTSGFPAGLTWKSGDKERKQKLFTSISEVGIEKQVTMKNLEDLVFDFYQQYINRGQPIDAPILEVTTLNLTASVNLLRNKFGCLPANITSKFSVRLSPVDGLPEVISGLASCELHEKKGVVDDVKGFFGLGKREQEPLQESVSDSITIDQPSSTHSPATSATLAADLQSSTSVQTPIDKIKVESVPIKFISKILGTQQPSDGQIKRMKDRLAAFDASDFARAKREEAFNNLESFIYRSQDLLTNEEFVNLIPKTTIPTLEKRIVEASGWLYEDGADAPTLILQEKLDGLKELVNPGLRRREEHAIRPAKIVSLQQSLRNAKTFAEIIQQQIDIARSPESVDSTQSGSATASPSPTLAADDLDALDDNPYSSSSASTTISKPVKPSTSPSLYTQNDLDSLLNVFNDINSWLEEKIAVQAKLVESEEPVLTVGELNIKARELEGALNKVMSKLSSGYGNSDSNGKKKNKGSKGKRGSKKTSTSVPSSPSESVTATVSPPKDEL